MAILKIVEESDTWEDGKFCQFYADDLNPKHKTTSKTKHLYFTS